MFQSFQPNKWTPPIIGDSMYAITLEQKMKLIDAINEAREIMGFETGDQSFDVNALIHHFLREVRQRTAELDALTDDVEENKR